MARIATTSKTITQTVHRVSDILLRLKYLSCPTLVLALSLIGVCWVPPAPGAEFGVHDSPKICATLSAMRPFLSYLIPSNGRATNLGICRCQAENAQRDGIFPFSWVLAFLITPLPLEPRKHVGA
jgi:hypothetical protein